jgi:hypothetical protein
MEVRLDGYILSVDFAGYREAFVAEFPEYRCSHGSASEKDDFVRFWLYNSRPGRKVPSAAIHRVVPWHRGYRAALRVTRHGAY